MKMEEESKRCKVCVTGANGYIGSCLVNKLLQKGYTVHATLRDTKNQSKVDLLKSLPHYSQQKLLFFEADIYDPASFDPAIQGCEFVFHVATPLALESSSRYKDMSEAAVAASRSIAMSCLRSGTARRLIYTASVVSASPLKDDGSGFKDSMDETCWTILNDSYAHIYHDDFHKGYTYGKTLSEKVMLSYGSDESGGGLEIVTLPCGLVGGDTFLPYMPGSVAVLVSQITGNAATYSSLKLLQALLGKIPVVHVDDVCEAHIFCMENSSINGRFLCASSYISVEDIANHYILHYPEFNVKLENGEEQKKDIKWASTKLCDKGFVYKYDAKMILDDCIKCSRRTGHL